jgi:hypothetical protein
MKCFFFLALASQLLLQAAEDIRGFWKVVNDEGLNRCVVAVYPYQGLYFGRIIATYDDQGALEESIYKPIKRAPGLSHEPYYCGLDFIWNLADSGSVFKGKILDPEHGDVYRAELWRDGDDLMVRGKLLIFGRTQRWFPLEATDLPKDFKKPDLNALKPSIPVDD